MTLRRKTLLITALALVGLTALIYFLAQVILLNSFTQLEDQSAKQNVQRVLNSLSGELDALNTTTSDWAYWDDTYEFMQDHNSQYVADNFVDSTFADQRLNLIVVIDNSGERAYAQAFDLAQSQVVPIPTALDKDLQSGSLLLTHSDLTGAVSGIMLLPEGPLLVSSRTVLTTEKTGPATGTLIFGRYLDSAKVDQIAHSVQLSLTAYALNSADLPATISLTAAGLSPQSPVAVHALDNQTIAGYALVSDIYGKPAVLMQVTMPRDIYAQGQTTISYVLIALLVVGVVFVAGAWILLERLVLSRLAGLSADLGVISVSGNPAARVKASGSDELGQLSAAINRTLDALEKSQETLRQNEQRLTQLVNNLQDSQDTLRESEEKLQATVETLDKQNRRLQRVHEFFRESMEQLEDVFHRGGNADELTTYLTTVRAEFEKLDKDGR
jgi:sensor domain CHASE-containing protein